MGSAVNNPYRYAGYVYDDESGIYYLNSRHYDPTIARFMQEDTYWNTNNNIYGGNPKKYRWQACA
jgi:RHS repeat-associated protein